MRAAHLEGVEEALWSAVASLREHSSLLRRLAARGGDGDEIERQAAIKDRHAHAIEEILRADEPGPW